MLSLTQETPQREFNVQSLKEEAESQKQAGMILRGCQSKNSLPGKKSQSQPYTLEETEYLECNALSSF